jgi:hypothetical protein
LENSAFARLGAKLGRIVGNLLTAGIELHGKDIAARLRGNNGRLAVVGNAVKGWDYQSWLLDQFQCNGLRIRELLAGFGSSFSPLFLDRST